MEIINTKIQKYITENSENEPLLLQELNRETHLKSLHSRMLSGAYQGRILSMISKLIQPKYIVEIGTFTGYSALCLAEGLIENGQIITIDVNEETMFMAEKYFQKSPQSKQIKSILGNAKMIIPTLENEIDLVFIDADKENYIHYFDLLLPKMKKGAILLSDNVLWSGKVIEEVIENDKSTQILLEYNQKLKEDKRVETIILPIRDGLTISRVI